MRYGYERFRLEFPEEVCLAETMRLRHGRLAITCPACDKPSRFAPVPKLRACACQHCGHLVHPCAGTPLATLRTSLVDWFFAIHLKGQGEARLAEALRREAGCHPRSASRIVEDLARWAAGGDATAGWQETLAARMAGEADPAEARPKAVTGASLLGTASDERPARTKTASKPPTSAPLAAPAPEADDEARPAPIVEAPRSLAVRLGMGGAAVAATLAAAALLVFVLQYTTPATEVALSEEEQEEVFLLLAAGAEPDRITQAARTVDSPEREAFRTAPSAPPAARPSGATKPAPAPVPTAPRAPGVRDPDEILSFGPIKIRRHLVETILRAAATTDSDPSLLMAIVDKESSFVTKAQAKTSSALGLFQFIEATWLKVVLEFGARYGLEKEAKAVTFVNGRHAITDPAERTRILDMRREPYISALMAAEMLKGDRARIAKTIGRDLTNGETYLAHFLGPDGAERFMDKVVREPGLAAAELLPAAARANRPIFYAKDAADQDKGLTVAEVHKKFEVDDERQA